LEPNPITLEQAQQEQMKLFEIADGPALAFLLQL
jgi:hypothetical protein